MANFARRSAHLEHEPVHPPVSHPSGAGAETSPSPVDAATTQALDGATSDLMQASSRRDGNWAANADGQLNAEQIAHAAVLEQMAHGATYAGGHRGGGDAAVDGEGVDRSQMLRHNGYNPDPQVIQGNDGLQMVVYRPLEGSDAQPVVSFRGTEELDDLATDFDVQQAGNAQYESNRDLIDLTMHTVAEQYGAVEATGHSLGGSLAQIAASHNLDDTGHITAFQAPGVSSATAQRIEDHNAESVAAGRAPVMADHFNVDGCLVSGAGAARAPGTVHDMTLAPVMNGTAMDIAAGGLGLAATIATGGAAPATLGLLGAAGASSRMDPFSAHVAHPLTAMAMRSEVGRDALQAGIPTEQGDGVHSYELAGPAALGIHVPEEVTAVRSHEVENGGLPSVNEVARVEAAAAISPLRAAWDWLTD